MNLHEGSSLPLEGVRVVDWSTALAAPTCGRLLADLGADVIKVEMKPNDMFRGFGDVYGVPSTHEHNPLHATANSNKRFITIDPRSSEALEIFARLLQDADVLVTSVRTKVQKAMGLSYEDLKEKFPRLIFAHLTGYGYNGAEFDRPGFDLAAFWARSGALIDWVPPGSNPLSPGLGTGDIFSGTALFGGITSALYARERTGKGTLVTTSLMGTGIWANGEYIFISQPPHNYPIPKDPSKTVNPFYDTYQCKDGQWVTLMMPGPLTPNWKKACGAFGLEQYFEDARFCGDAAVIAHGTQQELCDLIRGTIASKTFDEWHARLTKADVVHEKAQRSCDLMNDEQALVNGYMEKVTLPEGRETFYPTVPIQFSEYRIKPVSARMGEGQDTREILGELDFDPQEIDRMYESGAIL